MRNYSDAGQDRVCVHGAATSSRRSTSLSRAWLRDVCKPRENCGGLGQQGPGIRANMLRYHILTHALDSQRLNLPSGRINQAGASWQRGRKEVERREDCAGVLVLAGHKGTKQDQGVQHSGAGDARVRVGRGHRRGCVA